MAAADGDNPHLETALEALRHPVRWELLIALREGPLSAQQVADVTDLPVERVRHHLRVLVDSGVIELSGTEVRRGVAERYYFLPRDLVVEGEDYEELSPALKRKLNGYVLKTIMAEAVSVFVSGPVTERPDTFLTRTPTEVDEEGWRELVKIHRRALDAVQASKVKARRRIEEGSNPTVRVSSVLMLYDRLEEEERGND